MALKAVSLCKKRQLLVTIVSITPN